MFDTTDAKCREVDPDIFFPDTNNQPAQEVRVILSLCSQCPVFKDCHDYAMQHDLFGWWAGTTREERKAKQKALGIVPTPISFTTNYWLITEDGRKKREQRENDRKAS